MQLFLLLFVIRTMLLSGDAVTVLGTSLALIASIGGVGGGKSLNLPGPCISIDKALFNKLFVSR